MNRIRAGVPAHARMVLQRLEQTWPGAAERLHDDALGQLETWPAVQVRRVPDSAASTHCSVAGGYVHSTLPPTLTVAESLSVRRQHFTALHELGHHLQKNDPHLALAVRRQPADREAFEDAACDVFASLVLIPDGALPAGTGSRSMSAADVVDLFGRTRASRAACCVRVAEQLGTHGVVTVHDANGAVAFAAAHGEVYPPARGSSQAGTPLLAAALRERRDVQVDETFVQYSTGDRSEQLYGDAAWSGQYLITVAVLDRPGWKAFAPPRAGTSDFTSRQWTCEVCGEDFKISTTCSRCSAPRCPAGHCTCTAQAQRQCPECFLLRSPSQFASRQAVRCRDCEE